MSTPDRASSGVCLSLRSEIPDLASRYMRDRIAADDARRMLYALHRKKNTDFVSLVCTIILDIAIFLIL